MKRYRLQSPSGQNLTLRRSKCIARSTATREPTAMAASSLAPKISAYLTGCRQTAMCGNGRYARLLYLR